MGALRRVLIRVIRFLVLRPLALVGLLVVVLILAAVGLLLPVSRAIPTPSVALPSIGSDGSRNGSAPQATEDYLKGNRDYDADLVWQSLDQDAQQRFSQQGGSLQSLQTQLQAAKSNGVTVDDYSFVGSKPLPDGASLEVYVVTLKEQPNAADSYVPYLFTLDSSGKIAKVQ